MGTSLQKIIEKTGREPVECQCSLCQAQCRTPCLGTPDDILRLIRSGYKEQLAPTLWCVGIILKKIDFPILMVQARQIRTGCIFYKNGLCELHESGLKPTEGKLSHHSLQIEDCKFSTLLSWNVAKEWMEGKNAETIWSIFQELR